MKTTKKRVGKIEADLFLYTAEHQGHQVEIEAHKGLHRMICEWCVRRPDGRMLDYGVTYGLADAKDAAEYMIGAEKEATNG